MMASPNRSAAELNADLIDVHILDMTAQIEALLRGIREVQRGVLTVRGAIPTSAARSERLAAAEHVRERLAAMLADCDALKIAIAEAVEHASRLPALAGE